MSELTNRYGQWALVTGATSGIGAALVERLAAAGLNVIIVARGQEKLDAEAARLRTKHGVEIRTIAANLATPEGTQAVIDGVGDTPVGVFVPCAALENKGYFVDVARQSHRDLVYMDVTGPVELVHHFARGMADRRRGGILLVSSLSGLMTQPFMAHYGAAKAFVSSLGESLHHEMKDFGVDITVLTPGPTDTPMAAATGMDFGKMGMAVMKPDDVAAVGLAGLLAGRIHAIPGLRNRMMVAMMGMTPRPVAGAMFKMMLRKQLKIALPPQTPAAAQLAAQ